MVRRLRGWPNSPTGSGHRRVQIGVGRVHEHAPALQPRAVRSRSLEAHGVADVVGHLSVEVHTVAPAPGTPTRRCWLRPTRCRRAGRHSRRPRVDVSSRTIRKRRERPGLGLRCLAEPPAPRPEPPRRPTRRVAAAHRPESWLCSSAHPCSLGTPVQHRHRSAITSSANGTIPGLFERDLRHADGNGLAFDL